MLPAVRLGDSLKDCGSYDHTSDMKFVSQRASQGSVTPLLIVWLRR